MGQQGDDSTKLIEVRTEEQAALIVAALADAGISAKAQGGLTAGFRVEIPGGVDVFVQRADLDRAREILREIKIT
jgi:hypothetical protein